MTDLTTSCLALGAVAIEVRGANPGHGVSRVLNRLALNRSLPKASGPGDLFLHAREFALQTRCLRLVQTLQFGIIAPLLRSRATAAIPFSPHATAPAA